jgi:hypothetical protein
LKTVGTIGLFIVVFVVVQVLVDHVLTVPVETIVPVVVVLTLPVESSSKREVYIASPFFI